MKYQLEKLRSRRKGRLGRPPIVLAKGDFYKAYRHSADMVELAEKLGVCLTSAYRYCAIYQVPNIRTVERRFKDAELFSLLKSYRGKMTLMQLGRRENLDKRAIRAKMRAARLQYWKVQKRKFPEPRKLMAIKVYWALCDDESMWDDPDGLSAMLSVSVNTIENYLEQCIAYVGRNNIDLLPT